MAKNVKLCREYNADIITTSGAVNKYGLRSARELAAVTNLLGLELGKAIESVSSLPEEIIKSNREKLSGKRWEGARVVE
jgi:RNase P/RNase MRP subunit p30